MKDKVDTLGNQRPMLDEPEDEAEWLSQFFDFNEAAQETELHAQAPADTPPEVPRGNCFALSEIPMAASDVGFQSSDCEPKGTTIEFNVRHDTLVESPFSQSYQPLSTQTPLPPLTTHSRHVSDFLAETVKHYAAAPNLPSGTIIFPADSFPSFQSKAASGRFHCFDWRSQKDGDELRRPAKKRRIETSTQKREEAREVREKGSCLRCYILKFKCSSGYPCITCSRLFERAHGSKSLQWRACINSSLVDLNIFTYSVPLLSKKGYAHRPDGYLSGENILDNLPNLTTPSFYDVTLTTISEGGETSLLSYLDSLYVEIMQLKGEGNGPAASIAHTYIADDRNPLFFLLRVNTILVGSRILGAKLIGFKHLLHYLRAMSSVLAFKALWLSLKRTALANSSHTRLLSLLVYISLLLDQITEIGTYNAAPRYLSNDDAYRTMHSHVVQYLTYYLKKICTMVFRSDAPVMTVFKEGRTEGLKLKLHDPFWEKLSTTTGLTFLKSLPKVYELLERGNRTDTTDNVDPALTMFLDNDLDIA